MQISSRWGTEDGSAEGQRNNILQKAITLYVGQLGLKYDSALVVLSSVKEKGNRDEDSYSMVHNCRNMMPSGRVYNAPAGDVVWSRWRGRSQPTMIVACEYHRLARALWVGLASQNVASKSRYYCLFVSSSLNEVTMSRTRGDVQKYLRSMATGKRQITPRNGFSLHS